MVVDRCLWDASSSVCSIGLVFQRLVIRAEGSALRLLRAFSALILLRHGSAPDVSALVFQQRRSIAKPRSCSPVGHSALRMSSTFGVVTPQQKRHPRRQTVRAPFDPNKPNQAMQRTAGRTAF